MMPLKERTSSNTHGFKLELSVNGDSRRGAAVRRARIAARSA
jgi:hypothetical protein